MRNRFKGLNTVIGQFHFIFRILSHTAIVRNRNHRKRTGTLKRAQKVFTHTKTETYHDYDRSCTDNYTEYRQ